MNKPLHRFLLVSDMHYTTDLSAAELKKIHPESNASAATGTAFGKTQREKVEKVYEDIMRENERSPLDAVLVLGDLSIDDYDFRNLPINYCMQFKKDCLDRLPFPYSAIPGNHDSYPDDKWREVFGNDREFVFQVGNAVFIMADTFNDIPAVSASGSAITSMNEEFIKSALTKYKGKKIFICAHYIEAKSEGDRTMTPAVQRLIKDNSDVVFLFRGHTHVNNVIDLGNVLGGKKIVDIGGYGYCGIKIDNRYEFNIFDKKWAWGYQILEIYEDRVSTYHVTTDNVYNAVNGIFELDEQKSEEISVFL